MSGVSGAAGGMGPGGALVVRCELALLGTALRRGARWGAHGVPAEEYEALAGALGALRRRLERAPDLRLLDPAAFLRPFLAVIRSKETTGPVTSLALSAVNKFLAYGLIDPTHPNVPATVEDIADAVTHARFVSTDHSSDGVVLMKILQVLRTLMLSPEGAMLTDESVCEIMLSCFRISFETRLNELLRRFAEQCLRDMTQLIFTRLPQFAVEDATVNTAVNAGVGLSLRKKEKSGKRAKSTSNIPASSTNSLERNISVGSQSGQTKEKSEETPGTTAYPTFLYGIKPGNRTMQEHEFTIELPEESRRSPAKKHGRHSSMDLASNGNTSITQLLEKCVNHSDSDEPDQSDTTKDTQKDEPKENDPLMQDEKSTVEQDDANKEAKEVKVEAEDVNKGADVMNVAEDGTKESDDINKLREDMSKGVEMSKEVDETGEKMEEYVNPRGIRFMQQNENLNLQPYGLVCVRELFRFLISLCNPLDSQNTTAMVNLGLSLVGTALEVGADHLATYQSLLNLVKDPLSRNLLSLLGSERITIFALDLQISFLLFESMRHHLKLQMESFFKKLIDIISADVTKATYEMKEITHLALESLAQMFQIPGLCTELYLNYDLDIYCTNLFEDLTKLLSKHAVSSTTYNTHNLSLDALMTIIEAIEATCNQNKMAALSTTVTDDSEAVDCESYGRGCHVSLELGGMDDASVVSDHVTHDISQYITSVKVGRNMITSEVPSETEIENIKNRKQWIATGTELFNQKPDKGIEYLQERGILETPLSPHEVAIFLRENPGLDKKMIGDYICKRSKMSDDGGPSVLSAFADSFDYNGLRVDQALRLYLEAFRLPGEAPLIFLVMEHFAERWHTCNGMPFANTDAAFRLAYAIIMLNMDQHNHNAKKLNVPMNAGAFVKNLRGCNGSGDFDQAMLEAVFNSIKNEEIVMPAEHVGLVKENYLWKVLLRRGTKNQYLSAVPGALDDRLFAIAWGPTVTALSSAFERAPPPTAEELENPNVHECAAARALAGLEQCAGIVATRKTRGEDEGGRAGVREDVTLDTLVLSMCKFTGLLARPENPSYISIGVTLGQSTKSQLALRRACFVMARHADCLRVAWKHLLEIVRTLYVGRLLPKNLLEAEDYLTESKKVTLIREPSNQSRPSDAGLLSSLYSYIAPAGDNTRMPTSAERALIDVAIECVNKCNLTGVLVTETKFLQLESLQELVKQLAAAASPPSPEALQLNPQLEDLMVFFLELLAKTTVQNRDRVLNIWPTVSSTLTEALTWGALQSTSSYTAKRALTALLKTVVRLMRNEECAPTVLDSLNALLSLPYRVFYQQADRISCGLYELVKSSAQNVHSADDWGVVLALLAAAGAGAWPREEEAATPSTGYCSASSRSEGSEDESSIDVRPSAVSSDSELSHSPHTQGWILVKNETGTDSSTQIIDLDSIRLRAHRPTALARCTEALALVVRDVAHVTPYNFPATVRAVRLFVQASLHGGKKPANKSNRDQRKHTRHSSRRSQRYDDLSDEEENSMDQYHMVSIQLLDLMHTLHSRTAQIFRWWREEAGLLTSPGIPSRPDIQGDEEYDLWEVAWMPLLQGIAKLCTDHRKQVANSGIAYLQRALLAPGLQALGGAGWEGCFQRVLFPLVEQVTERVPRNFELTARANTIMCKVFLHHLSALSSRPTFSAIWLRVVAVQRTLVAPASNTLTAPDDALREAALESLKNMILVMDSVKVFVNGDGYSELWQITWEKISEFLPNLKEELFPQQVQERQPPVPPSSPPPIPTLVPPSKPPASAPPAATPAAPAPPGYPVVVPPLVRNPLYMPAGPQSSVLLQPLSQMVSTPIGITIPTQSHQQGFPILYPNRAEPTQPASNYQHINILEPSRSTQSFTLVSPSNLETQRLPSLNPEQQRQPLIVPEAQRYPNIVAETQRQPSLVSESQRQPSLVSESQRQPSLVSESQRQPSLVPEDTRLPEVPPILTNMNIAGDQNNVAIHIGDEIETNTNDLPGQTELYKEYLTNPYNDAKELSLKEATIYEPEKKSIRNNLPENQIVPDTESKVENLSAIQRNPHFAALADKKSLSANCSPMHDRQNMQFSSSDNIQNAGQSGMFNFSSYFGLGSHQVPSGSEILFGDSFMPTQEG